MSNWVSRTFEIGILLHRGAHTSGQQKTARSDPGVAESSIKAMDAKRLELTKQARAAAKDKANGETNGNTASLPPANGHTKPPAPASTDGRGRLTLAGPGEGRCRGQSDP